MCRPNMAQLGAENAVLYTLLLAKAAVLAKDAGGGTGDIASPGYFQSVFTWLIGKDRG